MPFAKTAIVIAILTAAPAAAQAAEAGSLSVGDLFLDAALPPKLVMALLFAATLAAIAFGALALAAARPARGAAFVSGLRTGGPLLGLLGAAYTLMSVFIGVSNIPAATLTMAAPGFAEATFMVALGLLAGTAAAAAHWAIESRAGGEAKAG